MINIYIQDTEINISSKFNGWKFIYPEIHSGPYAFTDRFINLILELEKNKDNTHIITRNPDLVFNLILKSLNNKIYIDENNFSIYIGLKQINSNDFIINPYLFVKNGSMYFAQKLNNLFNNKSDITQTKSLSDFCHKLFL